LFFIIIHKISNHMTLIPRSPKASVGLWAWTTKLAAVTALFVPAVVLIVLPPYCDRQQNYSSAANAFIIPAISGGGKSASGSFLIDASNHNREHHRYRPSLLLTTRQRQQQQQSSSSSSEAHLSLAMCICVDCAHVINCDAYHYVETQHEQPHMNLNPTFTPVDGSPRIYVHVRSETNETELARMWSEHATEQAKAEAKALERGEDPASTPLYGETVYNIQPTTTVEYDVVACQSFVMDKGCWVRNMPDEIRKANPNFVPP
jgi:hypothetical protein